ncbi:MAG: DEAD/DEAH box helicase [Crocinitomicaceae bacterium]|jgi:ATP-dependent RNA helicase RhlE|nr:DEAD/DEAH box helicase [Crocinitomicaceae bacterium]
MKFKDYSIIKELKDQLERMAFKKPTDIQFKAIPAILNGEDVMAIAQTGTGKTAAFVIPILDQLVRKKRGKYEGVRTLVMVPTRELAQQITDVFQEIGKDTDVKTFGLYGGVEQEAQIKRLNRKVDVLVATPGRMFDLISQGHLDVSGVEHLILDEADLMLDKGFLKDIQDVVKKIPKKRQTLFFTATIDKKIKSLAYSVVKDALRIQISPKNPVAKNVDHAVAFVEMDHKRFFLENVLTEYEEEAFLVFVRTKVRAERVVAAMERVNIKTTFFHGGLEQGERFKILDAYRKGEIRVLVTTDVAARGIDIPAVKYVVNYDLPEDAENYVHRCGRCGRGRNKGQAISFCSKDEEPLLQTIEEYTGENIARLELDPNEYGQILFDADDPNYDWQKLIDQDNDFWDKEDNW